MNSDLESQDNWDSRSESLTRVMYVKYLISIVSVGSVYALITVGFAMIYGVLRLSNFAHGVVMVAGAFMSYLLTVEGVHWIPVLLATTLGCAILSMLIEFLALRRLRNNDSPPIYLFVASVAVLITLNSLIDIIFGSGARIFPPIFSKPTLQIWKYEFPKVNIMIGLICVGLLVLLNWFLKKTKVGISIRAAADNQRVCGLMGINTDFTISLVFALAGALAGVAGMFLGISYSVYPGLSSMLGKAFIATIIGGMGSLLGAVIGAFILATIQIMAQLYAGWAWVSIISFTLSVLFLYLRPRGIMGIQLDTKV